MGNSFFLASFLSFLVYSILSNLQSSILVFLFLYFSLLFLSGFPCFQFHIIPIFLTFIVLSVFSFLFLSLCVLSRFLSVVPFLPISYLLSIFLISLPLSYDLTFLLSLPSVVSFSQFLAYFKPFYLPFVFLSSKYLYLFLLSRFLFSFLVFPLFLTYKLSFCFSSFFLSFFLYVFPQKKLADKQKTELFI